MCKSKFQLLYTYLFITFVALVGVANHFNFADIFASDSFVSEDASVVELEKTELDELELPAIAKNYSAKSQKSATTGASQTVKVNLPAIAKVVNNTNVDAGYGINRYHSLLYGHSTLAGGAFKNLYVGDLFTAVTELGGTRQTYRVVARKVYDVSELTDVRNMNEIVSIYENKAGITLMTCGNGHNNDSSQRLVLWAVAA